MHRSIARFALSAAVGSALAAAAASRAGAQSATVSPGMSRDEVVHALGKPTGERESHGYTYLFFANGCERRCGMSDVVTLEDGHVSDAVFRKPGRQYTGRSSSPAASVPGATLTGQPAALRVEPRTAAARPSARVRRATDGRTAPRATDDANVTRAMIVAPRRAPVTGGGIVASDSTVTPRGLADTTTSTGTRFGPPLSTAPGPRTPQTPGLGAPPSRDSSVRNGVQLPPGSVPVPFQGARPSSVDSARAANERPRPTPASPVRTPR